MAEIESLEKQFRFIDERRRVAEAERKRVQGDVVITETDKTFSTVQKQIDSLKETVEENKLFRIQVNLPAFTEMLMDIAKGYDEAIRSMLTTITEYNRDERNREITGLQERFVALSDQSNGVLQALNAIIVKLDAFTGNLELERKVLLKIDRELPS